jgi:hypothetical protein
MDIYEFILALASILAWPVAIIVGMLIIRREMKK